MEDFQSKTEYCLNCKNKPCQSGCPLGNDIPEFILLAKEGKYKQAYDVLSKTTIMPFICGKICPKSKQCQGKCVRGIKGKPVSIGEIESKIGKIAIANEWYFNTEQIEQNSKKIAIIGSGPAGITASIILARNGWNVTIYEKREKIGGILRYGIPEFRLEKKYIDVLEEYLKKLKVNIETSKLMGRDFNLKQLLENNDVILLSNGANTSRYMGIPGEENNYVVGANELLEYGKYPDYTGKKVAIIGGGNVALDASRTIKKLGAKDVNVIYRRAREQMPAEPDEVEEAEKEGIKFLFQSNPKSIKDNKVECVKTKLVQKEGEKRLVPVEIDGSNFNVEADFVVMAIGSKLDRNGLEGIELNENGYIKTNEYYETSIPHVYAAGDNAGGIATVAWASYYGREAGRIISEREV